MLMEQQWWLDRSSLACGMCQVSYLCKFCLLGKYDWGCWNNGADSPGSLIRCISFVAIMNDPYVFAVITLIHSSLSQYSHILDTIAWATHIDMQILSGLVI